MIDDPQEGDIVREKKYAQPLKITHVTPFRTVEVQPDGQPAGPRKWLPFHEIEPYKKEGT